MSLGASATGPSAPRNGMSTGLEALGSRGWGLNVPVNNVIPDAPRDPGRPPFWRTLISPTRAGALKLDTHPSVEDLVHVYRGDSEHRLIRQIAPSKCSELSLA